MRNREVFVVLRILRGGLQHGQSEERSPAFPEQWGQEQPSEEGNLAAPDVTDCSSLGSHAEYDASVTATKMPGVGEWARAENGT